MTTPQPVPLIDEGNSLLAQVPVQLHTGSASTPTGKIGILTLRSASTTFTAFVTAEDIRTWVGLMSALADQLSGNKIVPASPLDVATLNHRSTRR